MPRHPDKPRPSPAAASAAPLGPRRLATVLLRHQARAESHYDWMLEDPTLSAADDDNGRTLWTARVAVPSAQWARLGQWDLEPIAHHRRAYLEYEGPLSNGRGQVVRVDEGTFTPILWREDRIEMEVAMREFAGRIELVRQDARRWQARVMLRQR